MAHTTLWNDLDNFVKVEKDNFDWIIKLVEKETGYICKVRAYPMISDYYYFYNKKIKDKNGAYIKIGLIHGSLYYGDGSLFYDGEDNNEYYINKDYVSEMRKALVTK